MAEEGAAAEEGERLHAELRRRQQAGLVTKLNARSSSQGPGMSSDRGYDYATGARGRTSGPMSRSGARYNGTGYDDQRNMTRAQQYGSQQYGGRSSSAGRYR